MGEAAPRYWGVAIRPSAGIAHMGGRVTAGCALSGQNFGHGHKARSGLPPGLNFRSPRFPAPFSHGAGRHLHRWHKILTHFSSFGQFVLNGSSVDPMAWRPSVERLLCGRGSPLEMGFNRRPPLASNGGLFVSLARAVISRGACFMGGRLRSLSSAGDGAECGALRHSSRAPVPILPPRIAASPERSSVRTAFRSRRRNLMFRAAADRLTALARRRPGACGDVMRSHTAIGALKSPSPPADCI